PRHHGGGAPVATWPRRVHSMIYRHAMLARDLQRFVSRQHVGAANLDAPLSAVESVVEHPAPCAVRLDEQCKPLTARVRMPADFRRRHLLLRRHHFRSPDKRSVQGPVNTWSTVQPEMLRSGPEETVSRKPLCHKDKRRFPIRTDADRRSTY